MTDAEMQLSFQVPLNLGGVLFGYVQVVVQGRKGEAASGLEEAPQQWVL